MGMSKYKLADFKIGNKAKVIDPGGSSAARMGDTGVIQEIRDNTEGTLIAIETKSGKYVSMYWFRFAPVEKD